MIGVLLAICLILAGLGVMLGLLVLPLLIWLVLLACVFFSFVFWIWMLIDCIKNENISGNEKVAWALAIALTHVLGAIIYFFAGRTRRPRSITA